MQFEMHLSHYKVRNSAFQYNSQTFSDSLNSLFLSFFLSVCLKVGEYLKAVASEKSAISINKEKQQRMTTDISLWYAVYHTRKTKTKTASLLMWAPNCPQVVVK